MMNKSEAMVRAYLLSLHAFHILDSHIMRNDEHRLLELFQISGLVVHNLSETLLRGQDFDILGEISVLRYRSEYLEKSGSGYRFSQGLRIFVS